MDFDRHGVESDLFTIGCERMRAFSMSAAVAEIVMNAEERHTSYVITYGVNDEWVTVEILHYNASAPGASATRKRASPDSERGRGYLMARSLVKKLQIIPNIPVRGFTVRLEDLARRPKQGEVA